MKVVIRKVPATDPGAAECTRSNDGQGNPDTPFAIKELPGCSIFFLLLYL
jgi:hypothetical protein